MITKILFDQIPLPGRCRLMTMNGAVLPVMAFYIVAAEEQGVANRRIERHHSERHSERVHGTQHHIYPPGPSMWMDGNIFHCSGTCQVQRISMGGYHMQRPARAQISNSGTRWRMPEYILHGNSGRPEDRYVCAHEFLGHRHESLLEIAMRGPHYMGQDYQGLQ
jgi:methylmalonyl-CoA mutase